MRKLIVQLFAMFGLAMGGSAVSSATQLTQEDKVDITVLISQLVWGGFETREEIIEAATEAVSPIVKSRDDLDTDSANTDAWGKIGMIGPQLCLHVRNGNRFAAASLIASKTSMPGFELSFFAHADRYLR